MKLKPMKTKSKVTIKGDRTGGFILEVQDSMGFKGDIALTMAELEIIYQILTKKFEKNTTKERNKSVEKKFMGYHEIKNKVFETQTKINKTTQKKVAKSVKKRAR